MFLFQHLTPERVLIDPVVTGRDPLFRLLGERCEDLGRGSAGADVSVHPRGLDYPSVDQMPVQLVFCLIGDSKTAADHLAGLARLARLARQPGAMEELVKVPSAEAFIDALKAIEEG